MSVKKCLLAFLFSTSLCAENWPGAAGPNGNYQIDGQAPIKWSAVRNENIKWRTSMSEAGQSAVTVWGDYLFTTVHKPIKSVDEKKAVKDIVALCLDANTGEILWQKDMSGAVGIELASGFSDGTVFAPLCDGEKVWFFNRCGQMACFDMGGNEVWKRSFTPRYMHTNRQAEPKLLGDTLLYVEIAEKKDEFVKVPKKDKKTKTAHSKDKDFWTYLHGIDKNTGEILWREKVGTTVHCNPMINQTSDGKKAMLISRGGPHDPVEGPAGLSLINLERGYEGELIWNKECTPFVMANFHWNKEFIPMFSGTEHITLDTKSGEVLKRVDCFENVLVHHIGGESERINFSSKKKKPMTYYTNILIGDDHYFLAHGIPYIGKVNIRTGKLEYLQLPSQLVPDKDSANSDKYRKTLKEVKNLPVNNKGFEVGHKGHNTAGFGHISSASPILVGKHLIIPVVTGTVFVIDIEKPFENGEALVAVNDLGEAGKTWTLSSFSYAKGNLYTHTMKEIICIKGKNDEVQ